MKLSIITICLNNREELQRTVASVVGQTCNDYEYIVVDGGSTDGCRELIASTPRIDRWVSEPDTGIYNAMNKGVRMAGGDYVLFLNSGDTLRDRDVLGKVVPRLGKADFYAGHYLTDRGGKTRLLCSPRRLSAKFLLEGALMHQATFTRTALLRATPYDERLRIVADWAFLLEQWLMRGCTYEMMDVVVSVFAMDGVSTNKKTVARRDAERREVMDSLLPARVREALLQRDAPAYDEYVEQNIHRALAMPPVRRDLKLLRNAAKFLLRDLFGKGRTKGNS